MFPAPCAARRRADWSRSCTSARRTCALSKRRSGRPQSRATRSGNSSRITSSRLLASLRYVQCLGGRGGPSCGALAHPRRGLLPLSPPTKFFASASHADARATLVPRLTSRSQGAKSLQRLQELMRESIASNKAALELCEVRGGRSKRRRRAAWLPAQRTKASARFLLPLTASPLHPLPHGRRSSTMRRSFVAAWGKRPSPGCS